MSWEQPEEDYEPRFLVLPLTVVSQNRSINRNIPEIRLKIECVKVTADNS